MPVVRCCDYTEKFCPADCPCIYCEEDECAECNIERKCDIERKPPKVEQKKHLVVLQLLTMILIAAYILPQVIEEIMSFNMIFSGVASVLITIGVILIITDYFRGN